MKTKEPWGKRLQLWYNWNNTLFFSREIPQSLTNIPWWSMFYTVNTPLRVTFERKQHLTILTWSLKQYLVGGIPQILTPPTSQVSGVINIGHQLCSISQYLKRYLQKHCQLSLKDGCLSVLNSLFSDPDNRTWPSNVKVPISFLIMKSNQVYMYNLRRKR